ncbi:hypothetical protein SPRG_13372 [Saprolegnia parasitica CBS 223.65]|uniref:Hydroxyproline O-arabinosyltransferase-like domain-containing protein n=1 Tax=Saprolegnia parasitica (strain CBS 223.65) TaxID=695850 RepID=A0A067C4T4_SAPPC|nr:hypothetical protein SPRG_13372 [Saprolegnia parasitica CBS 223.65]KDO21561.1 hypothetical protein SPRG_13372 [Saprolegnia parasitica CBS 223.65]|eukprot:XP_012207738.1 hypothetical protein SPRG_13372 [Saprolegnia parasitica CBS 223.65]
MVMSNVGGGVGGGNGVHMVFSTSCLQPHRFLLSSSLQLSAARVGQVIAGCTLAQQANIEAEPTFFSNYTRIFTRAFSPHPQPDITDEYDPYNKPFALRAFLQQLPPTMATVIALVDADYMLLRPWSKAHKVVDGHALAQDWSVYLDDAPRSALRQRLCRSHACKERVQQSPFMGLGPPYLFTLSDGLRFVDDYCELVVRGRALEKNDWMLEMVAYEVAVANAHVHHERRQDLGVTDPHLPLTSEHWAFLNDTDADPCSDPIEVSWPREPPTGLHYCQVYGPQPAFYKYDMPEDITECNSMLFALPTTKPTQDRVARHETWVACSLLKWINYALLQIKTRTCRRGFNTFRGLVLTNATGDGSAYPQPSV